jgi:hypothetical protein
MKVTHSWLGVAVLLAGVVSFQRDASANPRHVVGDYDGDGKTDLTTWRPSNVYWNVLLSSSTFNSAAYFAWGAADDVPVPGDYDGDGKTDLATWRRSNGWWNVLLSGAGYTTTYYVGLGEAGDIPLAGDYDGDGRADPAMWRPSDASWHLVLSGSNYTTLTQSWGAAGDVPVPGDYDGDGKTDLAVWGGSSGAWSVLASSGATINTVDWGVPRDIPVPGDYDGDGKTDFAVWRPSDGTWYVLLSGSRNAPFSHGWGVAGDIPVPGDYDGDGKTDLAVWRPSNGTWYVLSSSSGFNSFSSYEWGLAGDIPIPNATTFGWTPMSAPFVTSTMLLLTDGRVMVQDGSGLNANWWALTPDRTGSYVNGFWTQLAPMSTVRTFYAPAILEDGRVVVFGGDGGVPASDAGEVYDPVANTWTPVAAPPGWSQIGDPPCAVLPNGQFLLGSSSTGDTEIWDPPTNTWTSAGLKSCGLAPGCSSFGESWALLPGGTVVTIDANLGPADTLAELWAPGAGWSRAAAGTDTSNLLDSDGQSGPAILLNDGRVMYFDAWGDTHLYTPGPFPRPGSFAPGPTLPIGSAGKPVDAHDDPAVLLPNGHVLLSAGATRANLFFDVDPTVNPIAIQSMSAPPNVRSTQSGRFLLLPTGEALYSDGSSQLAVFGPVAGTAANTPTITGVPSTVTAGQTFTLTGTLFNGLSEAVGFGGRAAAATNYPLVRFTHVASGTVTYARTHDHSTMDVATGATPVTTQVSVPPGLVGGSYQMQVVVNGVASSPWPVLMCASGFADCDGNPANGCETYIAGNWAHCGGCGIVCSVPCCQQGVCSPKSECQ